MSYNSDGNLTSIQTVAQYADQWQLKHLQYEGGPDNGGGSTTNIGNRIMANRIPDIKAAVIHNYADNWFSANANGTAPQGTNDVVCYFVMSAGVSRYGCWGATEDLNHIQNLSLAPKYDALCELTGMCGNEPTINLTTPLNNAVVQVNNALTISANATDPDGIVNRVEFFAGSELIGVDSIAPYSIQWTPTQTGINVLLAKSIDNHGKFTFTDGIVIEVSNTSEINELNKIHLSIFPVPAGNVLMIQFSKVEKPEGKIEVRDVLGKLFLVKIVNDNEIKINVDNLKAGIYFITLKLKDGNSVVRRITVNR
jgi:hypothetical protein